MQCLTIEMDEDGAVKVSQGITVCGGAISIGGVSIPADAAGARVESASVSRESGRLVVRQGNANGNHTELLGLVTLPGDCSLAGTAQALVTYCFDGMLFALVRAQRGQTIEIRRPRLDYLADERRIFRWGSSLKETTSAVVRKSDRLRVFSK